MIPKLTTFETKLTKNGIFILTFNRPKNLNTLSVLVYDEWLLAMNWAKESALVKVLLVTGNGKYFSAGHELAAPVIEGNESPIEFMVRRVGITKQLVATYIQFPKPIIHALQGNAVGFAVTSTALCDLVYCVEDCTFQTPFMKLGLCVEACSTVTFPRALGKQKAMSMLFLGSIITAKEMMQGGIVTEILAKDNFMEQVMDRASQLASFSFEAVAQSLNLVRLVDRDLLLKMNDLEMELLVERLQSEDFQNVVVQFLSTKKSRL